MFKPPPPVKEIYEVPVRLGADSWQMNHTQVGVSWEQRFYITVGQQIHIPNATIIGSKLYYNGKEMTLFIAVDAGVGGAVAAKISDYGAAYTLGTDVNGTYLTVTTQIDLATFFYLPYAGATFITAMVFSDYVNNYPAQLPPKYITSAVVT